MGGRRYPNAAGAIVAVVGWVLTLLSISTIGEDTEKTFALVASWQVNWPVFWLILALSGTTFLLVINGPWLFRKWREYRRVSAPDEGVAAAISYIMHLSLAGSEDVKRKSDRMDFVIRSITLAARTGKLTIYGYDPMIPTLKAIPNWEWEFLRICFVQSSGPFMVARRLDDGVIAYENISVSKTQVFHLWPQDRSPTPHGWMRV